MLTILLFKHLKFQKMKASFLALALACAFSISTVTTHASPAKTNDVVQIVNPFEDIPVLSNGLPLGTLDITSFTVVNNALTAVGSLTTIAGSFPVQIPVTSITGTCSILHLELGPLDLDLLGLVVHLDRVVLDISAQSAPGNLLGNLLCAITNLLNNPSSSLAGILAILNRILDIF
jgi:hypothetical protein